LRYAFGFGITMSEVVGGDLVTDMNNALAVIRKQS
jgi:hypothetical protein